MTRRWSAALLALMLPVIARAESSAAYVPQAESSAARGAQGDPSAARTAQAEPSAAPAPRAEPSARELLPEGYYLDTDGVIKKADEEYERIQDEEEPRHFRSLAEMGIGLGILTLGYWTTANRQIEDWDDPSVSRRFDGSAWRFDNNQLVVNYFLHPMAGGISYSFARANHHGVAVSAGYAFLTSFLWEFVFEFRELVSVNDMIATPLAGIPIGEFLYKLGLYLDTAAQPRTGTQIAQWGLGTGVQLSRALDGADHAVPPARDSLGMTSDIWHDFQYDATLNVARDREQNEYGIVGSSFRGRLVSIPGYMKPGRFSRLFSKADVASMEFGGEASKHGPGLKITADTLVVGYHTQDVRGSWAAREGYAATLGASVAFRYLDSHASGFREQFSAIHMPGPGVDWYAVSDDVAVELRARAHPDFVGAGSYAYEAWTQANPNELGPHILRNQQYFYGWGASGELSGRLQLGPLVLKGNAFLGKYAAQRGLNRWQERLTVDPPARTRFFHYTASAQLEPPGGPVAVGVNTEVRSWNTHVGAFRRRARVQSYGLQLSIRF